MKFCYIDESGTGDEPYAVMVGVLVDAYRMRPTKIDWDKLMSQLAAIVDREVKEFHTRDFYAGNSPWRDLNARTRVEVLTAIFQWYASRKHHIVYSAIDKSAFNKLDSSNSFVQSVGGIWRTLAMHIALSIQKNNQRHKNNKGNTVLVFDSHDRDEMAYSELVLNPPAWTDSYYGRKKNQSRLDQLVDVPHFVQSSHVGMIQIADCISYFLRRHIEIEEGKVPPKYEGEQDIVASWARLALKQSIPRSAMYPQKRRCDAAEHFYAIAPNIIVA